MVLDNRFPMNLLWGRELLHIYNEAYLPVLGAKHPAAIGRPAHEVWREIWDIIGPQMDLVLAGHGATWNDRLLLPMNRKGFVEETYFTFSYTPVRDDEGGIGGLLVTCQECTADVLAERQLEMLRDLGAQLTLSSATEACKVAATILSRNHTDLPFALLYLVDRRREGADLVAHSGLDGYEGPLAAPRIAAGQLGAVWPLFEVEPGTVHVIGPLRERVGRAALGRSAEQAVVVALTGAGQATPYGYLVAGVSPLRALDDRYKELFRLTADQIALGLARAHAYEEERRRAEALAELDRAKNVFLSNVSHELRTPLTLMLGPLEDARSTANATLHGPALDMVQRNAVRLLKLVNGLLDFARIEAGRAEASYQETDLPRLTADLASSFRSAVESAGLVLRVDCPPLDARVYVDRELWERIVLNLLSNALKFTFEGEIAVSLARVGQSVELSVQDSGTGIAPDELPRIFERFHRVKGARSRTHEGTGIGLSLVLELVKLHGGEMSVESELGVGTTFRVQLPIGSAHLPAERIAPARALEAGARQALPFVEEALGWLTSQRARPETWGMPLASPQDTHQARVLVADDNADMRSYVAQLLGRHWQVECVADGAAALEAIVRHPPNLLLADVMMPGLDGFELLRRVRQEPATRELPVILLSARAGEEARLEGLEAGADDYMIKPFSARELTARVQMHLSLQRVRRAGFEAIRASEERFRALVTASSDVIYRTSADWRELRQLHGREFLADTTSPTTSWLEKYIPPEDRGQVMEAIARAIGDKSMFQLEHRVLRIDGSIGWTFSRAVPLLDERGEISEWFGAAVDVTERKSAEQQLLEADRRKDEFLAMLGHELRNPLAAIRNGTELLRLLAASDPRLARVQGVLERQSAHMARLIDGLLEISRIASGKIQLERAAIDLAQVLASVVEDRSAQLEARRLSLRTSYPQQPLWIWADKVRLAQVIDNLLGNAMKFTPAPGTVELSLAQEGAEAVLRVRDSGVGIRPETMPRLFQPFQQEAQDIAREAGGLGLGLALARGLLELHGGKIAAHSEGPGTGAEFTVRLPIGPAPRPSARSAPRAQVAACRVLVVEDNVDAGDTLSALLQLRGHQVSVALSGSQALELLRSRGADIVLCDLGLPGMSGYDVARAVRADGGLRHLKLVALTGYGQPEDRKRSAEAGFDAHLVKPVELQALDGMLARMSSQR